MKFRIYATKISTSTLVFYYSAMFVKIKNATNFCGIL